MNGEKFRKALESDLPEIVELYQMGIADMIKKGIFQWDEIYPNTEVLEEDVKRNEMYLLIKEEKIAACVVINEDQDESYLTGSWSYTEGKVAVIHRLCVHPGNQSQGNGRHIMELAQEMITSMGYHQIRMDTFMANSNARHLYEKLGYRYTGEVTFRKGQFCLMEKEV